jgi:hypothetical protein
MQKMLLDFLYDFFETKEEDMDAVGVFPSEDVSNDGSLYFLL